MRVGLGRRFLIESGFIVAVAAIAAVEDFGWATIVVLMAAAWLVIAVLEWALARPRRSRIPASRDAEPEPAVRVLQPEPEAVAVQEPEPAQEPEVTPVPSPEPEPEPGPERPRVTALAPAPEPEPEPEPVAAPEPVTQVLDLRPRFGGPREWNLWELERAARAQSGSDVARDEERSFLLMYLREFASAEGVLPADFDGLVRESFADVLDAVGA